MNIDTNKILPEDKNERYIEVKKQINSLIEGESNLFANLSNITSLLKHSFDYFLWVGFYLYDVNKNELVLNTFQGKVACTRIPMNKGVCGTSAYIKETIIVPNVDKFPGHIVCDSNAKSEIVIPIYENNTIYGVLDIDSGELNKFDEIDKIHLEDIISKIIYLFK